VISIPVVATTEHGIVISKSVISIPAYTVMVSVYRTSIGDDCGVIAIKSTIVVTVVSLVISAERLRHRGIGVMLFSVTKGGILYQLYLEFGSYICDFWQTQSSRAVSRK
jgi:hypothetical protein